MARQSFRLRRVSGAGDATGVGSFVRGTSDLQRATGASIVDQDAAIRSTGIITVSNTTETSTFSASAVEYNAVILNWSLTSEFVEASTVTTGQTGLISVAVVYSDTGYPETVADGKVIVSGTTNEYLHQERLEITTDSGTAYIDEPTSGKWAYYTLFAYYNTDGVDGSYFYERLASLEVIVPFDYGSRNAMWNRVPLYYREADTATAYLDPFDLNRGQLERFVDVFGFEVDRTRTLMDSMMVQYDPLLAEADAIEELATMLGLELNVADVGVSRTRALLHDIGYIRRQKGTLAATKAYLTAVSGGDVTVFTGASAPYYTFAVHAQRANLVANPQFVGSTSWNVTSEYSVTTTSASGGITITAGATATKVAIRSTVGVPVSSTTAYYTSAEITGASAPMNLYGGLWHTSASWNNWAGVTADASEIPANIDDRQYYQMTAPSSTGTQYPVFVFKLDANQSITFKRWMVEPNKYGSYFDGDSVFGGFLYQGFASDFKWSGTKYTSYSIYTTNRKKTQASITKLLPQILPVTLMGLSGSTEKYATQFDWIPGKTL
jgi:hypothetical protein